MPFAPSFMHHTIQHGTMEWGETSQHSPVRIWEGLFLTLLSLLHPSSESIKRRETQKSGRLLMKADIGDWWFRSTGQVGLVIRCPDLNRLTHPQSPEVLNNCRLPLEGRSEAEHNVCPQSTTASKDYRERKELNIANSVPPVASINWGFIIWKPEAGETSFSPDIP